MGDYLMSKLRIVCIVGCLLLLAPGGAFAQTESNRFGPWYRAGEDDRWYFDVLVGAELEPDYAGSDDSEVEPGLDARVLWTSRRGDHYFLSLGELGAVFYPAEDWALEVFFEYEEAREVDENPALAGALQLDDTVEGQFTLYRRFGKAIYAAATLQPDLLDRGKGLVTFVGLGRDWLSASEKLFFNASVDLSWGDTEHMEAEFGLTPRHALESGLAEYSPSGGLKSATLKMGGLYTIGRRLDLVGALEVEHYFSEAADSPLLRDVGSDLTTEAAVGLLFRF